MANSSLRLVRISSRFFCSRSKKKRAAVRPRRRRRAQFFSVSAVQSGGGADICLCQRAQQSAAFLRFKQKTFQYAVNEIAGIDRAEFERRRILERACIQETSAGGSHCSGRCGTARAGSFLRAPHAPPARKARRLHFGSRVRRRAAAHTGRAASKPVEGRPRCAGQSAQRTCALRPRSTSARAGAAPKRRMYIGCRRIFFPVVRRRSDFSVGAPSGVCA